MTAAFARRLLAIPAVVLGITLVVFLLLHLIPGDPARTMLGERATPEQLRALRRELGLDRPLAVQYCRYLLRLLEGDMGRSVQRRTPVLEEVSRHFTATVELALAAMTIALPAGLLLGVAAAVHRGSWVDLLCTGLSLVGISVPIFWLGLMLILIFSAGLGWLPFGGRGGEGVTAVTGMYLVDSLLAGDVGASGRVASYLVLPALTLATVPLAMIARMTRASMVEVMESDYLRAALARGLGGRRTIWIHALPNALLPVLTAVGLQFGYLLGGAVLTETVFDWPGVGRMIVEAVHARDYPLVQGGVLVVALSFALVNLAVDLAYTVVDPRIRHRA